MGWKEFEQSCYDYLNSKYGNSKVHFTKMGGEDSSKSDILVSLPSCTKYYIEVKKAGAQCGQFVLLPNDSIAEFEYSNRNKTELNQWSMYIINYMNHMYGEYRSAGTKGKKIDLDSRIFIAWIMDYYGNKGVKYFITESSIGYIIFPIEKFSTYFEVSAVYREKKSGSTNPGKRNIEDVERLLVNKNINDFNIRIVEKKMYVYTDSDIHKMQGISGNYRYFFKKSISNGYIVTKLSNTCNSNVIFQIRLKREQDMADLIQFENSLQY